MYSTCVQNLETQFSCSGDMIAVVKAENGSFDPDDAPLMGGLLSISKDMI